MLVLFLFQPPGVSFQCLPICWPSSRPPYPPTSRLGIEPTLLVSFTPSTATTSLRLSSTQTGSRRILIYRCLIPPATLHEIWGSRPPQPPGFTPLTLGRSYLLLHIRRTYLL